jgi:ketosteroid isomerase-like protein
VSIHDDRHIPSPASAPGASYGDMDGIADLADDFDQIALVVDWLDACRNRDLATLLDLYADDAKLECRCGEVKVSEGRAELESYWRPRLGALAPTAFGLEDITPTAEGVVLDYLSHDGKPVRILFTFSRDARIQRTACAPVGQALRQEVAGAADEVAR